MNVIENGGKDRIFSYFSVINHTFNTSCKVDHSTSVELHVEFAHYQDNTRHEIIVEILSQSVEGVDIGVNLTKLHQTVEVSFKDFTLEFRSDIFTKL